MILDALRFVKGAVAKTTFAPELKHFYISDERVVGYNGRVMLSCPIDIDIDAAPKAVPFTRAIEACKDTVNLKMAKNGRLMISSGRFRSYVECESLERVPPPDLTKTQHIEVDGSFLTALEMLAPFIAQDASRPWARGILLKGQSLFATNNIVLLEHWIPQPFPITLNIPEAAVKELLRIKNRLVSIQQTEKTATFHFEGDAWMHTNLLSLDWPSIDKILDVDGNQRPVTPELLNTVEEIAPFTDDKVRTVRFEGRKTTTTETEEDGTTIILDEEIPPSIFNVDQLLNVLRLATTIDLSMYPRPCPFRGQSIRGVIIGRRA